MASSEAHNSSLACIPDLALPGERSGVVLPFPADFLSLDGRRQVPPYETTRVVNVKERWRGRRLLDVFADEFGLGAAYVEEAAAAGRILVNRGSCAATAELSNGDVISHTYVVKEPPLQDDPIVILAEGPDVVVAQKPPGMPCHPAGKYRRASLTEMLRQEHLKDTEAYLHPVNRLDRETSGVVLLAKTRKAYMVISRELGDMHKLYLAKVQGDFSQVASLAISRGDAAQTSGCVASSCEETGEGEATHKTEDWDVICRLPLRVEKHRPGQPLMTVVDRQGGKESATLFRALRGPSGAGPGSEAGTSLVLCRPITGRTHQIRVHLAALGCPILGDAVYGGAPSAPRTAGDAEGGAAPMCLHAAAYVLRTAGAAAEASVPSAAPQAPTEGDASQRSGEGASCDGSLRRVLPLQSGVVSSDLRVVYRCCSDPSWVGG